MIPYLSELKNPGFGFGLESSHNLVDVTSKGSTFLNVKDKHIYMGVSKNRATPKSSILIGFSITNHPFWGTPIFGNTHIPPTFHKKLQWLSQFGESSDCPLHQKLRVFFFGRRNTPNLTKSPLTESMTSMETHQNPLKYGSGMGSLWDPEGPETIVGPWRNLYLWNWCVHVFLFLYIHPFFQLHCI